MNDLRGSALVWLVLMVLVQWGCATGSIPMPMMSTHDAMLPLEEGERAVSLSPNRVYGDQMVSTGGDFRLSEQTSQAVRYGVEGYGGRWRIHADSEPLHYQGVRGFVGLTDGLDGTNRMRQRSPAYLRIGGFRPAPEFGYVTLDIKPTFRVTLLEERLYWGVSTLLGGWFRVLQSEDVSSSESRLGYFFGGMTTLMLTAGPVYVSLEAGLAIQWYFRHDGHSRLGMSMGVRF